MEIKNHLSRIYKVFLGYHEVHDHELIAKLMDGRIEIQNPTYFKSTPAKLGVYSYKEGNHEYLVHRTRLGLLFQSLYRLKLGNPVILEGPPQRKGSGLFGLVFYLLGSVVMIALYLANEVPGMAVILIWGTYTLFLILVSTFEYYIVLHGFKTAARYSQTKSR